MVGIFPTVPTRVGLFDRQAFLASMQATISRLPGTALSEHFLRRLHSRFPELKLTESRLAAELASAIWYAAPGADNMYYVLWKPARRTCVFVLANDRGRVSVLTVYEPTAGWQERLRGSHGCPGQVVLASSTQRGPPSRYKVGFK